MNWKKERTAEDLIVQHAVSFQGDLILKRTKYIINIIEVVELLFDILLRI